MNTVIDSGKWTGASSEPRDPYAVLTPDERRGELRFGGGRTVLVWRFLSGGFLLLVGTMLLAMGWFGIRSTHPILDLAFGLLLISIAVASLFVLWRRVRCRDQIVPLLINDRELRFGTPQRSITIDAVRTIKAPSTQETLPDLAYTLSATACASFLDRAMSVGWPASPTAIARLNPTIDIVIERQDTPIRLDLPMLAGDASRIALIICDRVQKYQSLAGTKNA
jgi:hypothetical protein